MILSADDDPAQPSDRLFTAALQGIEAARRVSLVPFYQTGRRFPAEADIWPGENYKLLAGLVQTLHPKQVVEVGTAEGVGAVILKRFLPERSRITTFDIKDWRDFRHPVFTEADFADGRLVQHLEDLTDPAIFEKHRALLEAADFFFLDGPKDGVMEPKLLKLFETVRFREPPLMVVDDIRLWNMLAVWRGIIRPKLDLTSFGHWSGTGLIDWTPTPAA